MGNLGYMKVISNQHCCTSNICTPQPQLVMSQYTFDPPPRSRTHPSHYTQFSGTFIFDTNQPILNSSYLKKLQQASKFGACLQLRVLTALSIPKDTILNLNAQGLQCSQRGSRDGHTYFGCKKRHHDVIVNDFKIPEKESPQPGRHFVIYYDLQQDSYFIKDLAKGFGVFLKIVAPTVLEDNFLLQMGDNFILVNLTETQWEIQPKLRLKLFGPPGSGEMFYFNPKEHTDSFISLGRNNQCDIQIHNSLTSKVQACISYNQDQGWMVEDGDITTGRPSTNGTWLYLNQRHKIQTGMVFKFNHTLFQANVVQNICKKQIEEDFQCVFDCWKEIDIWESLDFMKNG